MRLAYGLDVPGVPALSVPCGLNPERLPIGLPIIGHPLEDDLVLGVDAAIKDISEFKKTRLACLEE